MTAPTRPRLESSMLMTLFLAVALGIGCGQEPESVEHTLVLKNGTILKGELLTRTDDGFRFAVGDEVREVPEAEVFSLTLREGERPLFVASAEPTSPPEEAAPKASLPPASPAPAAPREPAPAPKQAALPAPPPVAAAPPVRQELTVPPGTRLMLRLDEDVSTGSHPRGAPISANLDSAIQVEGVTAAPKGAKVYGRVIESSGGKRVRNQKLVLEFTDITVGEQLVPIDTDRVGASGGGGSGLRKVGAGALIGGALGGKSGAGKGALVGGGLSLLAGGSHIKVPRGTLIELHLRTELTIEK